MKKIILILILGILVAAGLSLYIYSYASKKDTLPRPEDMAGREASAFLPEKIQDQTVSPGALKAAGPVWVKE